MKNNPPIKDTNYLLSNSDNYLTELDTPIGEILECYSTLIINYYLFIIDNLKITKNALEKFVIIRGLDTITNVFLYLLHSTKNTNATYFHCQKSFYFYVEFVGQMTDDEKTFLQLTSRDATTYVYKKTIFEINTEHIIEPSEQFREKMESIQISINAIQSFLLKFIQKPVCCNSRRVFLFYNL